MEPVGDALTFFHKESTIKKCWYRNNFFDILYNPCRSRLFSLISEYFIFSLYLTGSLSPVLVSEFR